MITRRPSSERGHANHGWLDTYHTFSFAGYRDPDHMGFRALRVLNDDTVAPGRGFGTHEHRDMEIVSYVLDGALEHRDSMGSGSVLRYGDVQRMSAGTGVMHSEFNHSQDDILRFLQIWVIPVQDGILPEYEERHFDRDEKLGQLRLIVAPDGRDDSLRIHQDVRIYAGIAREGEVLSHVIPSGRHAWIQVARGAVGVNGVDLGEGDGAAASNETGLEIRGRGVGDSEILVFDLA